MAAIPQELSKLLAGAGGAGTPRGPTPSSMGATGNAAPPGGPMTAPQPKEGLAQAAVMKISMVFKLLEQSLGAFGSTTEEGKAILSALKTLTGPFGKDRQQGESLIPAELAHLVNSGMPGGGGAPGAAKAIQAMPSAAPAVPPQPGA